jgi:hypothetical protein
MCLPLHVTPINVVMFPSTTAASPLPPHHLPMPHHLRPITPQLSHVWHPRFPSHHFTNRSFPPGCRSSIIACKPPSATSPVPHRQPPRPPTIFWVSTQQISGGRYSQGAVNVFFTCQVVSAHSDPMKQLMKTRKVVETSSPSINRRPERDQSRKQDVSPV